MRSRDWWQQHEGRAGKEAGWWRPAETSREDQTPSPREVQHPESPPSVAVPSTRFGPRYLRLVIIGGVRHGCELVNAAEKNQESGLRLRPEAGSSALLRQEWKPEAFQGLPAT